MGKDSRRAQRLRAFQVLYSQEFLASNSLEDLKRAYMYAPVQNADDASEETEPSGFGWELVAGVWQKREELDRVIERFARNWRLDRLGRVELNLLRLGSYEMLYRDDIPPRVTINEALELDKQFGDPRSYSFVNGILDAVCKSMDKQENRQGC